MEGAEGLEPLDLIEDYADVLSVRDDVPQLVWPGDDLTKHRHASRAHSLPPITFTRCRCTTLEPVSSAQLPLDSDDVTYFETHDSEYRRDVKRSGRRLLSCEVHM